MLLALAVALELGWLTGHLLEEWISPHACCQMELLRAEADNPDQRIATGRSESVGRSSGFPGS